jgi:hypothetical protein
VDDRGCCAMLLTDEATNEGARFIEATADVTLES